ncbi:hypothetical protein PSCT_02870 [Pseudomonas sp. SCT]|uniref:hypothetical protein n=1 Tax=Pseudomonas sp. (strain SCT) TaxID=412955 RepID=UPI000EC76363|nr:hypothetical protein [Pseudomonas sp. SCT]GCA56662.1 hypothetical protein PSCT_02870 [Pseudomonas sp. SCT]
MTSGIEQLLRPLRLRANRTNDNDLRQAVALLLDAQDRLSELTAERDKAQKENNRLRVQLGKLRRCCACTQLSE